MYKCSWGILLHRNVPYDFFKRCCCYYKIHTASAKTLLTSGGQIPIVIGCLPTQNGMHKSPEHFCLGSKLMPKLHHTNWLADIVYVLWLWSTSCVIRPKVCIMHHIGLSLSWLLLKIYLHTHFLWKICDLIWDSTLKDLIFEEKWWF